MYPHSPYGQAAAIHAPFDLFFVIFELFSYLTEQGIWYDFDYHGRDGHDKKNVLGGLPGSDI